MGVAFGLTAMAAALSVAAVCGAATAHASPSAVPCDYECMWPVGSYSIPEEVTAGEAFEVTWTYSWDPQAAALAAAEAEGSLGGHYAVSDVATVLPPDYTGSAVTLRLPQELKVVDWEAAGFEREELWVDHYDRRMYEYTGTNKYSPFGTQRQAVTVRLDDSGAFYPVTEIVVDLGLSERDGPPGALYVTRRDGGAAIFDDPPASPAESYPHRQALKSPLPRVEALPPGGAVGGMSVGDGETNAYGYFHELLNVPAANVRVCLYDRGEGTKLTLITRNGEAACTQTSPDGFYSLVFPRKDPDGDGTDADVTVRFSLEGEGATVMPRVGEEPYAMYRMAPDAALTSELSLGKTIAHRTELINALIAYKTINDARAYFMDTFSYEVPHVVVQSAVSSYYAASDGVIHTRISSSLLDPVYPSTMRHEYGHHIMASTSGIPPITSCNPHYFNRVSSESCAWVEGWANFVAALVADSHVTHRGSMSFDAEVPGTNGEFGLYAAEHGADVEARVTGVLWDIHDSGTNEAHDDMRGGEQLIWDVLLDEREVGERYPASSIHDFRDDWKDAGYPSLDGVFRQNGFPVGGGVTMSVLDSSGNAKTSGGRAHARNGETVRVTAELGASTGVAPTISFYGGAPVSMSPAGVGGLWGAEHAVTGSTREGLASFAISVGGETVATLHDVDAGGRVVVDKISPRALSAEFVAPNTIEVELSEPVVLPDGDAFAATPPGGSTAPSVSTSLSGDGTVVTLTLSPAASVDGDWSVGVPAALADPAGNAHGAGSVTAKFLSDSNPPTFTATREAATEISINFNEDIRQVRDGHFRPQNFELSDGERTIRPSSLRPDYPNRRITLIFGESVFAGTLVYRHVGGAAVIEDSLGNAVADGASAPVLETITPTFRFNTLNLLDLSIPTPPIILGFTAPVSGAFSVTDWKVNGKHPEYLSHGAHLNEVRAFPFTDAMVNGARVVHIHADVPACGGNVQVDYVAPSENPLSSGSVKMPSMGASTPCLYLAPHKATFLDSRTLRVTFDRPPRVLDPDSFLVDGLGPVLGHQEHESRAVTLHARDAAAAGTTYTVTNNDIRDTIVSSYPVFPVQMSMKATYMDRTAPVVTAGLGVSAVGRTTHVKLYLSEPLDADTLGGKVFAAIDNPHVPSAYSGSFSAHYLPGERVVYLIPEHELGRRGVARVSVPTGISDVNGVSLAAKNVGTQGFQRVDLETVVTGSQTVTVTLRAPLSEDALKHVWVSPSVGTIVVSQSGRVLTITTEEHFVHSHVYTVHIPPEAENVHGRKGEPPHTPNGMARIRFQYTDAVAPTATARFATPQDIVIGLSEPLNANTVTPATFSVTPPLGPLDVEYAGGGLEVLLRASEPARPGTEYAVGISGAADFAGLALSPTTLRVSHGASALLTGATFTSSDTIEVAASAPLDPGTLGGIGVSGLGQVTAEYDGASGVVTLKTARGAEAGATHRVFVPGTVLGAGGAAAGPVILEAVSDFGAGSGPTAFEAQTPLYGHVAVSFNRPVGPAAGSPGSLDASRWTVTLAGGEAITARGAVAVGRTVWLQYGVEGDVALDKLRRGSSIYMEAWSPRAVPGAALTVSYAPGGGGGDVADRTASRNPLAAVSLPVEDRLPPTFTARTARGATVVTFDRAVSGVTSAADWLVAGEPAVGVSTLDPGASVPASGAPSAALPAGTTRVVLHHALAAPDAEPLVSYAPRGRALAILSDGVSLAPWIARAADGVEPGVVDAAFTDARTLHVSFDEAPKAVSVSAAAFKVTGPAGAVVEVTSAGHTPHSRTVSLGLGSGVAPGEYSVSATGAITDARGNAAASEPAVSATYAPAAQGEPTISARAFKTIIDVTFDPPVSGTTSKGSWEVRGAAVDGIIGAGNRAVEDPDAASVPLPDGTTRIRLSVQSLGEGTADEPIVHHVGEGIVAGSVALGARAVKAAESRPDVVSVLGEGNVARVGFSEPISFSGGDAAARSSHWFGRVRDDPGRNIPVTVSTDGDSALVIRAQEDITNVTYDGLKTDGAVVDASGNFLPWTPKDIQFIFPVGLNFFVREDPGGAGVSVGGVEGTLVLPGIPVYVFSGSDGDRVGTWRSAPRFTHTVDVTPPLAAGDRYEVALPSFSDRRGITHEETSSFVYGSDGDPPTAESARFAGPREVRITFSEPLRAVPAGAAFSVTPAGGEAIPLSTDGVSHEAGLRTVTLSLSTEASPGAHGVLVPATVTDLAGNAYATPGTPVTATYDAVAPTAVSAAFAGEQTVTLAVSEALDKATVGTVRVPSLGSTSASYTAGSTTVTLHTQLAAAAGSSHAVVIPAGVTDINGVPLAPTVLWAARSDTDPPAALGARTTSPTTTEVDFGEAVRLGDSPTAQQHAAHWAVTEGPSARAVTGAEVVRGGLSVRLTHAPIGAAAMPSVSYVAGASHDDASVRDWATAPNYMASTTMDVAAGDGLPPSIDSLTMSVARPGEDGAPARVWARAGDMVRFAMSMSEAAGTSDPVIRLAGAPHGMAASGEGRLAWTHSHTVGMNAEQGTLAFVVSASDGGGNLAHAVAPTSGVAVMVDTIMPTFTARTLGAGTVEVTLSEPVRGTITASEWTVGGAAATGVAAAAGSGQRASAALESESRFVLWHGGDGTGAAPEVRYSPPARPHAP